MIPKEFQKIVSDNEQDRAAFEQWWREATVEDKDRVWKAIVRPRSDPVEEIITRMAQLLMGERIEKELEDIDKEFNNGPYRN